MNRNFLLIFKDDVLLDENCYEQISFLDNTYYELTYQKDLLENCESIIQLSNLIVNTLSIYENIFELQFVCYIILKRIYFTFPHFRKNIRDSLAMIIVNLCMFQEAVIIFNLV